MTLLVRPNGQPRGEIGTFGSQAVVPMRPTCPRTRYVSAASLGAFICVAAFLSLIPVATALESPSESGLVLRPTHRHGADPLDPYAAWFVSSYTATEPLVPHIAPEESGHGAGMSKEVADPLRRMAEPVLMDRSG